MTNKEKYKEFLKSIGYVEALACYNGHPQKCNMRCSGCAFNTVIDCALKAREWLDKEAD